MTLRPIRAALLGLLLSVPAAAAAQTTAELDAFWAGMSRAVETGDFDGYRALYHPDAVLVSETAEASYPIARAFASWEEGFTDTREGRARAGVSFRFTRRLHDATTAHETGMFRYVFQPEGEAETVALLHFQGLLVKKDGRWLLMMEFQQQPATEAEWEAAR